MTYARARLWLGISGVGLWVVLSGLALWQDLPGRWPADWPEWMALTAMVAVYATVQLPFDYLGGYALPLRFGRRTPGGFWPGYLRGAFVHAALMLGFALLLLPVGRAGGLSAVLGLQLAGMLAMVATQEDWAACIAGRHRQDRGYTGGIAGLPGSENIILPDAWPPALRDFATLRRQAAIESGSRTRGLVVAIGWNLVGFALCALLPGAGVETAIEWLRTGLAFTLWSFLGVLLLPTLSRRGVFEVDQQARRRGLPSTDFSENVRRLDALQDDEPQRAAGVETIFHPIPSVQNRIAAFGAAQPVTGAWNAARYALFLSWPCGGWLNRAVHCNVGRPELWVFLPVE